MTLTKKRRPLVSIGMPVYNAERYVRQSIESLQNQTYDHFELIISDNASTDATIDICQELARHDERIALVRCDKNLGAAKNYNKVFHLAQGVHFKWAASDDLCAADYLARCVAVLEDDASVILAYPKTILIDEFGNKLRDYDDGLHLKSKSASGRFLQLVYSVGECNAVFGLIRSDVLKKTRLIGNYIGSDVCLLAELSLLGRFYEIPDYLFCRRHHPGASSYHKDVKSQLQFFDPSLHGQLALQSWRHLFEHFKSLRRADIRATQKLLPTAYLLGSLVVSGDRYFKELLTACEFHCGRFRRKVRAIHLQRGM
ncbi:glycosyltransferase family 2 protein [candidate division KSB1 bacterium]|nr:glycosyltransferase family 2 protein [candidate division KSB1 bacterium]